MIGHQLNYRCNSKEKNILATLLLELFLLEYRSLLSTSLLNDSIFTSPKLQPL